MRRNQAEARSTLALVVMLVLASTGCTAAHIPPVSPLEPGGSASALIGPAGGTLELGSLELVVPAGALAADTEIRVTVTDTAPPGLFEGYSPIVRFEPEGTTFAEPIEVRIPYEGDADRATIFWSQRDGDAFVARTTRVVDGYAIATSDHFSSAFVGTACEGDDCCDSANGELDLLLVVDNSNSMSEEQALLAAEIPRLARILATGDRDGDGTQDFPALASIHVGVVSSDLGAGDLTTVPSCDVGWGDDGILFSTSSGGAGCMASYPSGVIEYVEGVTSPEDFASHVACVAGIGIGGCGFEQQLEATLIALSPMAPTAYTTPGYVPPSLVGGRPSHGDGANAGLLRDESILAVLELTDEADTSAADLAIFDHMNAEYASVPLNLRGTAVGGTTIDALYPVSRYVDGLVALRTSPHDLVFAAVSGIPSTLLPDPGDVDYDAVLGDPSMAETLDPGGARLVESCTTATGGMAFPARRIVETARGIDEAGGSAVLGSICDPSFDSLIDALVDRIAARASGLCE